MANLEIPPQKSEGTNRWDAARAFFWFLMWSVTMAVLLGTAMGTVAWILLFYGWVPE